MFKRGKNEAWAQNGNGLNPEVTISVKKLKSTHSVKTCAFLHLGYLASFLSWEKS